MTASEAKAKAKAVAAASSLARALATRDARGVADLLAEGVRWGSTDDTPQTCHGKAAVLRHYEQLLAAGVEIEVLDVEPRGHSDDSGTVLRARVLWPRGTEAEPEDAGRPAAVEHRLRLQVSDGLISDIQDLPARRVIELLFFEGCPNHEAFLPHLQELIDGLGIDDPVRTVEVTSDEAAHAHLFLGSPSLRVDGVDVDPAAAGRTDYGLQCRVYRTSEGARGTPPDQWVVRALIGPSPG